MESRTEVVQVELSEGRTLYIEATPLGGEEEVGITEQLKLEDVEKTIESVVSTVWHVLQKIRPTKGTAEFGIEVGIENGTLTGLLVKGSGKANVKVTLEWEHPGSEAS